MTIVGLHYWKRISRNTSRLGLHLQSFHLWAREELISLVYFQVLLTIMIMWGVCGLLTLSGTLPLGHPARTDVKVRIVHDSPWVRFPYPGKWIRLSNSERQEGVVAMGSRPLAKWKRWGGSRLAPNATPIPTLRLARFSPKLKNGVFWDVTSFSSW
jgi:hypothetical protein